jgi:hypothetical protein
MAINNLWSLYGKSCYDVAYYAQVLGVHQLWPTEGSVCCFNFDIVFFHDMRKLGNTLCSENVKDTVARAFWVTDWLPQDLDGNVDGLAMVYLSCAIQSNNESNLNVQCLARDLLDGVR